MKKNMVNVFMNKKWIAFKSHKSTLIKSPFKSHKGKTGIWIYNKFIFASKYNNQFCFGIDKNQKYDIYYYPIGKDSKIIATKIGAELIAAYEKTKIESKEQYYHELKENK